MAAGPIPETKKIVAAGVAADSIPRFLVLHVKSGCWDEWLLKHTYRGDLDFMTRGTKSLLRGWV